MKEIIFTIILTLLVLETKAQEKFYYVFKEDLTKFSLPLPSLKNDSKWWSSSIFGNVHKKICKKAYEFIDPQEYPDLVYYQREILDGCGDEDGHETPQSNGGNTEELWFATKNVYKDQDYLKKIMGVMFNYNLLKWETAYENIGSIVHLTQDQASPTHAANIIHGYFDHFERFYESDNEIKIIDIDINIPENLKPWEYYLFVQQNTRKKLREWIDPENGIPYWEESQNALPLDKDNTLGPYGRYGGGFDHFIKTICDDSYYSQYKCKYQAKSPHIRERQLTLSVITTEKLLKSASKNLPPLIKDLKIDDNFVEFNIYENRCRKINYFTDNGKNNIIEFNDYFPFSKSIKLKKDFFKITIIDCDGNKTTQDID